MMNLDTQSRSPQEDDMSQTQTLPRRRWTVRLGTDGFGPAQFEVYAATMEEARASVTRTAEESGSPGLQLMADTLGFTVHAESPHWGLYRGLNLCLNEWAEKIPAPDSPRELAHA
jgi:hypothetical protein